MSIHDDGTKADKALKLRDQGLSRAAIAERLGVTPANVPGMIQRAKERREKAKQEAGE